MTWLLRRFFLLFLAFVALVDGSYTPIRATLNRMCGTKRKALSAPLTASSPSRNNCSNHGSDEIVVLNSQPPSNTTTNVETKIKRLREVDSDTDTDTDEDISIVDCDQDDSKVEVSPHPSSQPTLPVNPEERDSKSLATPPPQRTVRAVNPRHNNDDEADYWNMPVFEIESMIATRASFEESQENVSTHPISPESIVKLQRLPPLHKSSPPSNIDHSEEGGRLRCSICLSSMAKSRNPKKKSRQLLRLPCHHLFHEECVVKWLGVQDKCPNCQAKVQV